MTDLQRSILAISTLLVILLVPFIMRSTDRHAERMNPVEAETVFDPAIACENAKRLASGFPERATGTAGSRASADWIESRMRDVGLETERQEFEIWLAGERVVGENIIGIDKGTHDEAIALIAHYDIPFHVREGAMDNASGVGVLLELSRVFSREKQEKTLVFIASDAEDWGMLGARHYVETHPAPEQIRAAVSLDYAPVEHPNKISLAGEGQFRGQVPLWLWMLGEDCVSQAGGEPISVGTLDQFVSQAVNISSTDQGPFLRAGIPGVNLCGTSPNNPLERKIYHTLLDTSENLRPELFDVYGKAAELMIRTLDELDESMDNNPFYLRTGRREYVGRSSLRVLKIILFLPLLLATCFQYYNQRTREHFLRNMLTEAANLLLFLLPWVVGLLALKALVWTNTIPRYELYPATPLDPFLKQPHWMALAALGAAIALAWAAVLFARRSLPFAGKLDFAGSKAVCLDLLLTLAIISLFLNGFAAVLFLAPAALLWGWIETGDKPTRACLNIALILGAAAPFVLLIISFSRQLTLGPYAPWYFLLGAGYGFFSPFAVLITFATATAGARLLQQSFLRESVMASGEQVEQAEESDQ